MICSKPQTVWESPFVQNKQVHPSSLIIHQSNLQASLIPLTSFHTKKSQCDRCFHVPFTMDVCCLTLYCWIYFLGGIVVHIHVVGSMCTIIVNILSPHPSIRMDSVSKISPDFCYRFRCYSHMVWFQLQLV